MDVFMRFRNESLHDKRIAKQNSQQALYRRQISILHHQPLTPFIIKIHLHPRPRTLTLKMQNHTLAKNRMLHPLAQMKTRPLTTITQTCRITTITLITHRPRHRRWCTPPGKC